MENNNGKGIFYGIIAVTTLIVAIIGATFAYFTANTTSNEFLQGMAATAGLNVRVMRLTTYSTSEGDVDAKTAKYVMVPQLDSTLAQALEGSDNTDDSTDNPVPGIDGGGSLVCSIYKIVVQNTGSAAITVSGTIDFYSSSNTADGVTTPTDPSKEGEPPVEGADVMDHLKWARLEDPDTLTTGYSYSDALSNMTIPTSLLTYDNTVPYQTTPDGTEFTYAVNNANQYLFAMEVEDKTNVDILDGTVVNGAHGAYTDLIDPTDDLVVSTWVDNADKDYGTWYLSAHNNTGDTKVFYVVVWISENNEEQNDDDIGQFTGTITFNSSEGSGATSTFTETVQDPVSP